MRLSQLFNGPAIVLLISGMLALATAPSFSQEHEHQSSNDVTAVENDRSTRQVEGLKQNPPSRTAITGATVHRSPDHEPGIETILLDGSRITAVGPDVEIPPGTKTIDATGKHVYAGLIDSYRAGSAEFERESSSIGYWNENVRPERSVSGKLDPNQESFAKLREAGFTAALVAPDGGVIQGQSSLVMLGGPIDRMMLVTNAAQHMQLTVSRGQSRGYPNSPMGAYALARQALYDAQWYQQALRVTRSDPTIERPETNSALAALDPVLDGEQLTIIETSNELFAVRADRFAREFRLSLAILGSGNEYRRLKEVAALGRPIILPVDFPNPPDVSSPELAADVSLETMMHWDHAPENPSRLAEHEVRFVLTSKGLEKPQEFLEKVRVAVKRGLDQKVALAAMTTEPAKLFGVESQVGSIAKGKIANLIVTDGDLFCDSVKVLETWVDGHRYRHHDHGMRDPAGRWTIGSPKELAEKVLVVRRTEKTLSATLVDDDSGGADVDQDSEENTFTEESEKIKIKPLTLTGVRLAGAFRSDAIGHEGISLFSASIAPDNRSLEGQLIFPDGSSIPLVATRRAEDEEEEFWDKQAQSHPSEEPAQTGEPKPAPQPASFPVNYPLGAFGRSELPAQPASVLIKNVTAWTLDEQGKLENAAVLIKQGKIDSVLAGDSPLPDAELVIDGSGCHLTPGIIDCHSHMATDSGVNESGQAITAEVRIGDMIDPDDINIYRQLAGGVTAANVLHGSANPIGGQNQVIKLRWGASEQEMKFENAPEGIKFALGENVKQSNRSSPSDRYPLTRMGVEQIIDDAFRAAKDYRRQQQRWQQERKGLPPRKDLELEALAEIVEGTRWIHCHSYRQDEILALMRTLEDHGITIGSFQHILEGYKVADAMAKHGAMGSAFADWWAYKYEVKDAIPYAGALMHRAGVVVSFNSDDAELGRHLNQEAAKAVRYGGVPEIEALKFVTLNPARQLRIDEQVGSIEPGKDADLVLWSGPPLSNLSIVKQTWVDGRKYFDREEDAKMQLEVGQQRLELIQKILASGEKMEKPDRDSVDPAKLWPRYDEFCHGHDHNHDE